ncbi:hypothetical protein [Allorhizocola rhizosphaerae]|uniref:hypothetical protein n=1 Tax=Allorhizocola rhizosphaerae TaxID=1872709 RepID=UPI000E3D3145|nr:hypothetical protein [Allorhizocola rhizosphaerae]
MRRLARAIAVVMTSLLTMTPVTGCTDQDDPRIPQHPKEGDGWSGMSLPHRRAGQPAIFDSIYLCIDRPGSIKIVDVSMEYTDGGFFVEAFATRPAVPPAGVTYPSPVTESETLWDLGYRQGDANIDTPCTQGMESTPTEHRTQVGVQFSKPTDKTARGALLRITYRSGDNTYSYRMGFEAVLCETEQSKPECVAWDYDWTKEPVRIINSAAP